MSKNARFRWHIDCCNYIERYLTIKNRFMENMCTGKVALVTGAGSGIGQATAILYAQHGAKVVVSDVNEQGGCETVDKIKSIDGDAIFVRADVSDPKQCAEMTQKALRNYGRLDIACNNA